MSTREFAQREGIAASTLYQWLAEARAAPVVRLARVVRRPDVDLSADSFRRAAAPVLVEMRGARVHVPAGVDRATLAVVLDLLGACASDAP